MKEARLYQKPKNALQSGRAWTDQWILEFAPSQPKRADPLTGWAGSGDTLEQVKLRFPDEATARAYAKAHDLNVTVIASPRRILKIQTYADNFR